MIVTITNTSGVTLNALDVHDGGSGAVGGSRKNPLPYPFPGVQGTVTPTSTSIANSGTFDVAMHPSDWRYQRVPWTTFQPKDEWNTLVFAGKVTLSVGAETGRRDQEELYINAV